MKTIFTLVLAVVATLNAFAQAPEKMSYQSVIRNSSNELLVNQAVGMKISILKDAIDGAAVYEEIQTPTTNTNGLVSLQIGEGEVESGDFSAIEWGEGTYFIKTETDTEGGTDYTITGTSQLMSVPYALHAKTVEEKQTLSFENNVLSISGGNEIELPISTNTSKTYVVLTGDITDEEAAEKIKNEVGENTQFIWVLNTTNLTTLNISGVSQLVDLKLLENEKLTTVSLPDLVKVYGFLDISDNKKIETIELPLLKTTGEFFVNRNKALISFTFPELIKSYGYFEIGENEVLTSFSCSNLLAVDGYFKIGENAELIQFDLSSLETFLSELSIRSNPNLTTVELSNVKELDAYVSITENSKLTSIDLPKLTQIKYTGINFKSNALTSNVINTILAKLVAVSPSIKGLYLDFQNQTPIAPPTGQGYLDYQTLKSNGNRISIDQVVK